MTDDQFDKLTDSSTMNSIESESGPTKEQPTGLGAKIEFGSAEATQNDKIRYEAQAQRTADLKKELFGMNPQGLPVEEETQEAKPVTPEPATIPEAPKPQGLAARLAAKQGK